MNYLLLLLVACVANAAHHVNEEGAPNLCMIHGSQHPLTNLFAANESLHKAEPWHEEFRPKAEP